MSYHGEKLNIQFSLLLRGEKRVKVEEEEDADVMIKDSKLIPYSALDELTLLENLHI